MNFWYQINFQEASRPIIHQIKEFHDHILIIMVPIIVLVLYFLFQLIIWRTSNLHLLSGHLLETLWTIFPGILLLVLAIPSIKLLYLIEERFEPFLTLKTVAHQWYWSYEYSDFTDLEFDSYMVSTDDLQIAERRLIERDHRVILPFGEIIRVLITSNDVIHCWSVPSLGVKCDAIPGRLNQLQFIPTRLGNFYGQCSEICGANHSFIPIALEIIPFKSFIQWI